MELFLRMTIKNSTDKVVAFKQTLIKLLRFRQGRMLFLVWTAVYWGVVSYVLIIPYDCSASELCYMFSWLTPVISLISLG
jgi:hypothetical protein